MIIFYHNGKYQGSGLVRGQFKLQLYHKIKTKRTNHYIRNM